MRLHFTPIYLLPFPLIVVPTGLKSRRGLLLNMELEDSDDLCPVCEDNCTCQKAGDVTTSEDSETEYFSRQRRKSRASKRSLLSPVSSNNIAASLGGPFCPEEAGKALSSRKRAKYLLGNSASPTSLGRAEANFQQQHIEISLHLTKGHSQKIGTSHSNHCLKRQPRFESGAFAGEDHSSMRNDQLNSDNDLQEQSSKDSDLGHEFDFDDEEDDDEDEIYLKYDSVEYEYIVSDLLANNVISDLALLEDPIESLDILLLGSNDETEEESSGVDGNCISFEIDLIPSQQHILPLPSQKEPLLANPNPTLPSKEPEVEVPKRSRSAVVTAGGSTNFSLSQPLFAASPATLASSVGSNSSNYSSSPLAPSAADSCCDGYDSFYYEDEFAYASSPEDQASASSSINASDSCSMLKIEDLLESTILTNSRQILYSDEFLERYKKIPISAFRRSRRRSFSQHRIHPGGHTRFLKHEDRMLCEGITADPSALNSL